MTSNTPRNLRYSKTLGFLTLGGLAATSLGFAAAPANASTTFAVTNCNDTGAGSLRQAIADQQTAGSGTVALGLSADMNCTSIELQTGITISKPISITGRAANSPSIRSDAAYDNIFEIRDEDDFNVGEVSIDGLVFDGLNRTNDETIEASLILLWSTADLNISNSRFTDNSYGASAMIQSHYEYESNITIDSSTFDGNSGTEAIVSVTGSARVTNSTFFNNYMFEGALVAATGRVDLINNSIVDTTFDNAAAAYSQASLHMTGNLIADTDSQAIGITSGVDHGGNLIADGVGGTTTSYGDITNTTPGAGLSAIVPVADIKLGTFANHGGSVPTYSLLEDSVALDYYTIAQLGETEGNVPARDARGVTRPKGAGFEPGAFEFGELTPAVTKATATMTLYFNSMSPKLTSKALGNLKKFVDRMPDGATNVAVTVLGYVQPSSTSGNDAKLSLSRAYATTKALKAAGISAARWNVKGKGKANETGAKARKVVVTFTYSIPAAG